MQHTINRGFASNFRHRWNVFYTTYWLLGREADLERLVAWATEKRLAKPHQAYQKRLIGTQTSLTRIRQWSPQIWALARLSFGVVNGLFPPPQFMRMGNAARYRRKLVDYRMKN